MSIYTKQQIFEKKVIGYGKLMNNALNALNGSFKVDTSSFNINIRIRASRNIDLIINMLNERNNDLTLYKTYESENIVLYKGYIKKDEYL